MKEFAEIKDGKVLRVIVCESKEWCETRLGGEWVERTQPAGKGYAYDKGVFIAPEVKSEAVLISGNAPL